MEKGDAVRHKRDRRRIGEIAKVWPRSTDAPGISYSIRWNGEEYCEGNTVLGHLLETPGAGGGEQLAGAPLPVEEPGRPMRVDIEQSAPTVMSGQKKPSGEERGGEEQPAAKRRRVLDYMKAKVTSGEWQRWNIVEAKEGGGMVDHMVEFEECYPDDDSMEELAKLADLEGLTGVDYDLIKTGLGPFVPVSKYIVAEARRCRDSGDKDFLKLADVRRTITKLFADFHLTWLTVPGHLCALPSIMSGRGEPHGLLLPTIGSSPPFDHLMASPLKSAMHVYLQDASGTGKSKLMGTLAETGHWAISLTMADRDAGGAVPGHYWEQVVAYMGDIQREGGGCGEKSKLTDEVWNQRVEQTFAFLNMAILLPLWAATVCIRSVPSDERPVPQRSLPTTPWQTRLQEMQKSLSPTMKLFALYRATPLMDYCCRVIKSWAQRPAECSSYVDDMKSELLDVLTGTTLFVGWDEIEHLGDCFIRRLPRVHWADHRCKRDLTHARAPGIPYHIKASLLKLFRGDGENRVCSIHISTIAPAELDDRPVEELSWSGSQEKILVELEGMVDKKLISPTSDSLQLPHLQPMTRESRREMEMSIRGEATFAHEILDRPRYFIDNYLCTARQPGEGIEISVRNVLQLLTDHRELSRRIVVSKYLQSELDAQMHAQCQCVGLLSRAEMDPSASLGKLWDRCVQLYWQLFPAAAFDFVCDLGSMAATMGRIDDVKGDAWEVYTHASMHLKEPTPILKVLGSFLQTKPEPLEQKAWSVCCRRVIPGGSEELLITDPQSGFQPGIDSGPDFQVALTESGNVVGVLRMQDKCIKEGSATDALQSLRCQYMRHVQRRAVRRGTTIPTFNPKDYSGTRLRQQFEKFVKVHPQLYSQTCDCIWSPRGANTSVITLCDEHNAKNPDHQVHILQADARESGAWLRENSHELEMGTRSQFLNLLQFVDGEVLVR